MGLQSEKAKPWATMGRKAKGLGFTHFGHLQPGSRAARQLVRILNRSWGSPSNQKKDVKTDRSVYGPVRNDFDNYTRTGSRSSGVEAAPLYTWDLLWLCSLKKQMTGKAK